MLLISKKNVYMCASIQYDENKYFGKDFQRIANTIIWKKNT